MSARRPRRRRRSRPPSDSADKVGAAARRLGIEQLYPEQRRVIEQTMAGRDVLMVLPTGFGKSACYQVPSMVLPKPVVVISPLVALLQDQHAKLTAQGIPCVRLDGSVRGRRRREELERIKAGSGLLVMTTPETLGSRDLEEALGATGVSLAAVDEAHCISEWGHDFRPDYLRLGKRLRRLGSPPLLALTATATERVREAIVGSLGLRDPEIVAESPHRSNLAFEVLPCEPDIRGRVLVRLARRLRRPGIIYCATRREVDLVYTLLRRFRMPAYRYHGGMTAAERHREQDAFMRPARTMMVATSAFGLGIDKRDIRYVLHYQSPASLEQYVQEAGRGGRDGGKANCILLYDPSDRPIHEALLARSRVRPEHMYRLGEALAAWVGEERSPSVEALALSAELGPRLAAALLAKLEQAELVHVEDRTVRVDPEAAEDIEARTRKLAGQFDRLRTQDGRRLDAVAEYTNAPTCRAVFLRGYFGEEADRECGLCDICRGSPERPARFFSALTPPKPQRRKKKTRSRGGRSRSRRGRRGGRRRSRKKGSPPDEK